jgi:DNA-binding NarL/FixJ family response regulator
MRKIIRLHLATYPHIALVGEACNFPEAVLLAERLRPKVILLDLYMKDGDGVDALSVSKSLLQTGSQIVAISIFVSEEAQFLAKQIGAIKLLDKVKLIAELEPTIRHAAQSSS